MVKVLLQVNRPSREAGFTALELLVTAAIMVSVMSLVLTAVDMNANVTLVQTDVADVQQSIRVAQRDMQRMVRMAGRGGLPRPVSVVVEQDVTDGTMIGTVDPDTREVLPETDILTVRGVFNSPLFRVDASDGSTFSVAGEDATLVIDDRTKSAFHQPLDALHDLVAADDTVGPEAILIVSRQSDTLYAIVELAGITFTNTVLDIQNQAVNVERATLTLKVGGAGHVPAYLSLSPGGIFPPTLTSALFVAVVEEYSFYIREDHSIPGDDTSPLSPKLTRARMVPGTGLPHPGAPDNIAIDIADNIFDFQVALGIDLDGDGLVDVEDEGGTPLAYDSDEWLWNDAGDNLALPWATSSLRQVRLSILGQTATADRQYVSQAIDSFENRDYSEDVVPLDPSTRRYRRRILQSAVDLRNL